jgi:glucose/arabinose dehydrogenase
MKKRMTIGTRIHLPATVAALFLCAMAAASVSAQQTKVHGLDPRVAAVPQTGRTADQLRDNLKFVHVPPGFRIELYAVVPDARSIVVGPSTGAIFVGTRQSMVWAVNAGNRGSAVEVRQFAPALKFRNPNGVCLTKDGALAVVETNRVHLIGAAESFTETSDLMATEIVPQGKLVPPEEESTGHGARVCRVGPDNKLYIAIGEPFNVPPREKLPVFTKWGIGGIVRMNLDGSGREVYASGIRNSVGMDFNPKDKTLWFTDNQTDGMGDDIPMGEINRATQAGQFFGYPYIVSQTRITENGYDKDPLPPNSVNPQVMTIAHAADLGMSFYSAKQFPAKYQGGFFSAQHGSWNRSKAVGAQVLFTSLKADGTADKTEVFATGWLDDATDEYRGRPVDVAVAKDGSLFVSDDRGGAIYRISYTGS